MRIPKRLIYKDRVIKVKTSHDKKWCSKYWGEIEGNVIRLAIGISRKDREKTFLHELIHLCAWNLNEKQVKKLEDNLYEILAKNKII